MKISTFVLFLASLASSVSAQTAKKPSGKSTAVRPSLVRFDSSVASLPAGFKGSDFTLLYKALLVEPQGEFETTSDYEARVKKISLGVYAFVVPNPTINYSADDGEFNVTFYPDTLREGWSDARDKSLLVLKESETETGEFVGTNAFGVSVAVREVTRKKWGVVLWRQQYGYRPFQLGLPISADRAKALKPSLRVLAVIETYARSIPPVMTHDQFPEMNTATGFDIESATIDSPIRLSTYYYAIDADLLGFWVFDQKTGEILGRYDSGGQLLVEKAG